MFYREPQPLSSVLLNVPASRAAFDLVEQHTGVAHESSQVLAMRHGIIFAHALHFRIKDHS